MAAENWDKTLVGMPNECELSKAFYSELATNFVSNDMNTF